MENNIKKMAEQKAGSMKQLREELSRPTPLQKSTDGDLEMLVEKLGSTDILRCVPVFLDWKTLYEAYGNDDEETFTVFIARLFGELDTDSLPEFAVLEDMLVYLTEVVKNKLGVKFDD